MTKWADYCITKVRYNQEHSHIVRVGVRPDTDSTLGPETESQRTEVISALEKGSTFVTVYRTSDSKWQKGKEVRIITVNGAKYIRTDANSKAADNLENLPEF
jgi:hypothetical protein